MIGLTDEQLNALRIGEPGWQERSEVQQDEMRLLAKLLNQRLSETGLHSTYVAKTCCVYRTPASPMYISFRGPKGERANDYEVQLLNLLCDLQI